jgi:hypothetical protein
LRTVEVQDSVLQYQKQATFLITECCVAVAIQSHVLSLIPYCLGI